MASDDVEVAGYLLEYCERMGDSGFWAEPLNAITNLAFIVCAYLAYKLLRDAPTRSFRKIGDIWMLVGALFAIGIGSGLWHTYARPWTVIADVIPIYIFINIYIFSLFVREGGMRKWQAALVWGAFQAAGLYIETNLPRDTLNGSLMYIPAYSMLWIGVIWLAYKANSNWKPLLVTTVIFSASIGFRTMDLMVCDSFPIGTHFLWHTLNAWVLYRLIGIVMPKAASA